MSYFVYMLCCSDGTLYTGSTNNLEKRLKVHNYGKAGAKYTRARRPVTLVYVEKLQDVHEALRREHVVKKLTRTEKNTLIVSPENLQRLMYFEDKQEH